MLVLALGEGALFFVLARGGKLNSGAANAPEELREAQKEVRKEVQGLAKISRATADLAEASISRVGLIRFNPFQEMGGDQSFSLALLDEKNNGVVVTGIHANDGSRTYAKPVEAGVSSYQLSREEEKAIAKAMKKEI